MIFGSFTNTIVDTVNHHVYVYRRLATDAWRDMTPMQYAGVLIFIAVTGWLMMKNAQK